MGSMWDVARKEVSDSFNSRRFLLILGLFTLFSLASVYMGIDSYQSQLEQFRSGGGWAPEKPSLMDIFAPMLGFNMPLAAGILALLLSYDAVSKEREEGTIELLLSYPVYRDEVINGKFVSGLFSLSLALLLAFGMSSGLAVYMTGQIPNLNQIIRLSFIWMGTIVYMAFFMALGSLFSTLFRSRWRSLIAGVLILLISVATPFIAGIAASQLYTYDPAAGGGGYHEPVRTMETDVAVERGRVVAGGAAKEGSIGVPEQPDEDRVTREEVMQKREQFREKISRFSPTTSYQRYAQTMLATDTNSEIEPTVSASINSAIGYIIFLIGETALMFTLSYGVFMRQDL
jgi:ABC-2 type transport system permease protein